MPKPVGTLLFKPSQRSSTEGLLEPLTHKQAFEDAIYSLHSKPHLRVLSYSHPILQGQRGIHPAENRLQTYMQGGSASPVKSGGEQVAGAPNRQLFFTTYKRTRKAQENEDKAEDSCGPR